jgi:IstB-like ATP binding protein
MVDISLPLTVAKLPLAKDLNDFPFEDTPINETLVRDLAGEPSRPSNAVLVGGAGTGKTHLLLPLAQSGGQLLITLSVGCRGHLDPRQHQPRLR